MSSHDPILETDSLSKEFGGLKAVDSVSTAFEQDQLHAVIGPNGAGKTTFFNLITGSLRPTSGSIFFKGADITGDPPESVARRGVIRSYQVQELFNDLTVRENVRVAVQAGHNAFDFWSRADDNEDIVGDAEAVLDRVGLTDKADELAANLGHGEQRMLELAISLGADPELLLLDEPTSGMNAEETTEMIDLISELAEGLAIVLVEHKMSVVMEVADRIMVLHNGSVIANGPPDEVRNDEEVKRVYLGGE